MITTKVTTEGVSEKEILNSIHVGEDEGSHKEFERELEWAPILKQALETAKTLHRFFMYHENDIAATGAASRLQDQVRTILRTWHKKQDDRFSPLVKENKFLHNFIKLTIWTVFYLKIILFLFNPLFNF